MTIYEHRTSLTAASGAVASTTLNIPGGILQNVLVRANTATTTFKANLVDGNSITRLNWGLTACEINDVVTHFPVAGRYTLNITNASPDDTFTVVLSVREN